MNLGKAVKLCRVKRGLTQSELAQQANISVSYLSLLERGKRDPNISTVEDIASALKVPMSILVFLASDNDELSHISPEVAEKFAFVALKAIEGSNHEVGVH